MKFCINTDIDINKNLLKTDFIKNWNDIVVAGGHIISAIKKNEEASLKGDIDIFFVGKKLKPVHINEKIKHIYKWLSDHYENPPKIEVYLDYINFICKDTKVQIITSKIFTSINELLDSFDLDCCRFAFDGKTIYTNTTGNKYLSNDTVTVYVPKETNEFLNNYDFTAPFKIDNLYSVKKYLSPVEDYYKFVRLIARLHKYKSRYNIQISFTNNKPKGLFQFNYDNVIDEHLYKEYGYPGQNISYKKLLELIEKGKFIKN